MFLRHCEGVVCFLLPLQCAEGREVDLKVRKKERKPGRVFWGRLAGAGTQGRSLFHFSQHRFGSNYSIHHPFEIYNSIASHQALVTGATCPSQTEIKSGSAFSERVDRNGFIQAKKITTIQWQFPQALQEGPERMLLSLSHSVTKIPQNTKHWEQVNVCGGWRRTS